MLKALEHLLFPKKRDKRLRARVKREMRAEMEATLAPLRSQLRKCGQRIDVVADLLGEMMYPERAEVRTDQESAWGGKHGFRYVVHHLSEDWKATRVPLWKNLLTFVPDVQSVAEFGCNIGANLKALREIRPDLDLAGVEINRFAVEVLKRERVSEVNLGSVGTYDFGRKFDLVFTRGVLIHIAPDDLPNVLANMERHAKKYVLIWENYDEAMHNMPWYDKRVGDGKAGVNYQFWRDFAGEFHKQFPNWTVLASGVGLEEKSTRKHGDLVWTIFRR